MIIEAALHKAFRDVFDEIYVNDLTSSRHTHNARVSVYFYGVIEGAGLTLASVLGLYGTNHPTFDKYFHHERATVSKYVFALHLKRYKDDLHDFSRFPIWFYLYSLYVYILHLFIKRFYEGDLGNMFVHVTQGTSEKILERYQEQPILAQIPTYEEADPKPFQEWAEARWKFFSAVALAIVDKAFEIDGGRVFRHVRNELGLEETRIYKLKLAELTELAMTKAEAAIFSVATSKNVSDASQALGRNLGRP